MKKLLSDPYVGRLLGAVGAGLVSLALTKDPHAAINAGATFLGYSIIHNTATKVKPDAQP